MPVVNTSVPVNVLLCDLFAEYVYCLLCGTSQQLLIGLIYCKECCSNLSVCMDMCTF